MRVRAACVLCCIALASCARLDGSHVEALLAAFSGSRLAKIANKLQPSYASADPFPHVVTSLSDLKIPADLFRRLADELPEQTNRAELNGTCHSSNCNCVTGLATCYWKHGKAGLADEDKFSAATRLVFAMLKSSPMLSFLSALTGIQHLLPDPHYEGSGVHSTTPNGHLAIHADFNRLNGPNLARRVNLFIFLNDQWPEEYGGHLELWDRNVTR